MPRYGSEISTPLKENKIGFKIGSGELEFRRGEGGVYVRALVYNDSWTFVPLARLKNLIIALHRLNLPVETEEPQESSNKPETPRFTLLEID